MSLSLFIPEVWSARLLANLQKQLVFGQDGVVNRDYEGEIREYGDQVHIHSIGEVTVRDYTRDTTQVIYELLDDERRTLLIDQSKYFAFRVDDLDQAQQKPKVIDGASQQATYQLADVADRFIAGKHGDAALVIDDGAGAALQITAANVYAQVVKASVMLDEANVPSEGRFMIVPPWVAGLMLQNDQFITKSDPVRTVLNGQVARVAGFDILKSNNVAATGTNPTVYHIMAGSSMAISYAEQIAKVEAVRLIDSFGDGIRGLHLYGAKVVRPDALLTIKAKK